MNESSTLKQEAEAEKQEQIKKIARVLYNEPGNEEWTMEQANKAAESLYRAGCRFDG